MNLSIEPFHPSQQEAARAVIIAVGYEYFGDGQPFEPWYNHVRTTWLASDVNDLAGHYGRPGAMFWVLLDGDEVVGTCGVRPLEPGVCELKRMYILPRARGLGWGRHLAETTLDWARGAGYEIMRLDSDSVLIAATALYRSLGFQPIDRYNDNEAELFFERRL